MATMDTVSVTNPTEKDFTFAWNKEEYTIPAKGLKSYPIALAMHAAKNLAKRILIDDGAFIDKKSDRRTGKGHIVRVTDFEELAKTLVNRDIKALEAQQALDASNRIAGEIKENPLSSITAKEAAEKANAEKAEEALNTVDPDIQKIADGIKDDIDEQQNIPNLSEDLDGEDDEEPTDVIDDDEDLDDDVIDDEAEEETEK